MYCGTFEDDLKDGVGLYRWPDGEVHICCSVITSMTLSVLCMLCRYFSASLSVHISVYLLAPV